MGFEFKYDAPPTVSKFIKSTHENTFIKGPIGSGKSVGCCIKIFRIALTQLPSKDGIRHTRFTVVRNCYDDQTEILTEQRGWVLFKDLAPTDKVATRVNNKLTFELPSYYYAAPYKGLMTTIQSKSLDMCVTPDHELWVSPRETRKKIWKEYRHLRASEIKNIGGLYRCTTSAGWDGEIPQQSKDFFEFMGFWFAEGCAGKYKRADGRGFHWRLVITQNISNNAYVSSLIKRNGFTYGVSDKGNGNLNYSISITPRVQLLIEELVEYGKKAYNKSIPSYIKNAPVEYIKAFLYGFQMGDGSFKHDEHSVNRLYTVSPKLAEDLYELVVKSGGSARLASAKSKNGDGTKILNGYVDTYQRRKKYVLTLRQENRLSPVIQKKDWGEKYYDGMVYCVTVSSHVVLTRRNGLAIWAGQTRDQLNDTTLKTWQKWFPDGPLGRYKISDRTYVMDFTPPDGIRVQSEVMFRALDDPGDVAKVLSLEVTAAWLNECREIPREIVEQLGKRCGRYPDDEQRPEDIPSDQWPTFYGLFGDTNAPEEDSYWYHVFEHLPVDEDDPESALECETFTQPPGDSPEAENVKHLPGGQAKYYAKGGRSDEWYRTMVQVHYARSIKGKPVYEKTFNPDRHISKVPLKIHPNFPIIIGQDCARSPASVLMQMLPNGRVNILGEATGFDMGAKTFIPMKLRPILRAKHIVNPLVFIGDPSWVRQNDTDDNSWKKYLKTEFKREEGHHIESAETNDPVRRITALDDVLRTYPEGDPLIQIDPSCVMLIQGLRSRYRFARIKGSDMKYHDRPEKNNWSHVVEAAQYGILFLTGKYYRVDDYIRINYNMHTGNVAYRPADSRVGY